ncbi:LacI family DNA-binding transcriptional regulator [Vreelandella malpeensis]|uniref:Substrate-binding domain-containing protein n=1 Tax=Vreelandella malpeensis TaxID=1172368 RepID=A0ABS8DSU9_9GAMM|nr:substrate-binding domain-containing protein [Halomonas malpeensis]MCB8889343.1 substrate-binding domain-containing protein [Halomonas malpeensis]
MSTIKEVASAAGCSTATVSRALATPDKVSEATRARVARAIAEVGYTPNGAARSLRRRESRTIVALLPDISNPFFSEIINGIEDVAHQAGYRVLIGDCERDPQRAGAYFDLLPANQADGMLLLTADVPRALLDDARRRGRFPLVMACEFFDDRDLPTVTVDNYRAACQAIDYLVALGHRRIATLTGPVHNPICRERERGVSDTLTAHGLAGGAQTLAGDFGVHSGYVQGLALLTPLHSRPTAIFCHSDEMAIGVIKAARQLGLEVPRDVSIIGFDNIRLSEYCDPELTTISQPRAQIGQAAMRLLLGLIHDEPVERQQVLETRLIVRQSTGQPEPR